MGQRNSDGSWLELQETAPSQEQAEFYAHRQREGLSYWGSGCLIRQMGVQCAAWLQEQTTSIGAAENLLGSRHCLQPFVYCLPYGSWPGSPLSSEYVEGLWSELIPQRCKSKWEKILSVILGPPHHHYSISQTAGHESLCAHHWGQNWYSPTLPPPLQPQRPSRLSGEVSPCSFKEEEGTHTFLLRKSLEHGAVNHRKCQWQSKCFRQPESLYFFWEW